MDMNEGRRYRNLVWDSSRWEGFEFRPGDIIISTPPKSGTTWTQMLCAMLIFDATHFPDIMDNLSPWLDMNTRSRDEIFDLLAAQKHRRFIKTHTPLDGLPRAPEVTYVIVGRDPRDVAISMEHHFANMDFDSFIATRGAAVGNDDLGDFPPPPSPSEDPVERMRQFVESEAAITNFDSVVGHLRDAWDAREQPNVALFHYRDYQHDLPQELRRLASVLGIDLDEERAAVFADAAGLSSMRERAEELGPDMGRSHWLDTKRFFRSGGRGEWADRFTDALAKRYGERLEEYAAGDQDFVDWIHEGRRSGGVDLPR
jgi:hypothetical protein